MLSLVLLAAVLYAIFNLLLAFTAKRSDAYAANAIFNGIGAILPLIVYYFLKARNQAAPTTKTGIGINIIAGVCIAVYSVLLVKIFAKGGNVSYVEPVIFGTVILLGALVGVLFLKEEINGLQMAGLTVTMVGIGMVIASKM